MTAACGRSLRPDGLSIAILSALIAALLLTVSGLTAEKNPPDRQRAAGWRNDGSGVFSQPDAPMQWSDIKGNENSDKSDTSNSGAGDSGVRWKVKLPGSGISSPVIVGERLVTTAEPAELICLSVRDGEQLWHRSHSYGDLLGEAEGNKVEQELEQARQIREQIERRKRDAAGKELSDAEQAELEQQLDELQKQFQSLTRYPLVPQGTPGNATSTPVSDGQCVWMVFGTGIVSCHSLEGERKWMKFVESPGDRHSASPLLVDGMLIVHLRDLVALDAETGEELWRTQTPARAGTPVVAQLEEQRVIVTPAGALVAAADGRQLADKLFNLAYCSPISVGDVCFAVENGATKALQLERDDAGQVRANVLWETRGARDNRLGSPVCHEGLLYTATSDGILEVLDAETGDLVYRERLDFGKGRVDPSLALAGGNVYVSSHLGQTRVIAIGDEFQERATNQLEGFSSSPVFQQGSLFIRTNQHLYRIGDQSDIRQADLRPLENPTERE